jgi:hypothetical protein
MATKHIADGALRCQERKGFYTGKKRRAPEDAAGRRQPPAAWLSSQTKPRRSPGLVWKRLSIPPQASSHHTSCRSQASVGVIGLNGLFSELHRFGRDMEIKVGLFNLPGNSNGHPHADSDALLAHDVSRSFCWVAAPAFPVPRVRPGRTACRPAGRSPQGLVRSRRLRSGSLLCSSGPAAGTVGSFQSSAAP